jgi:hypothetical protein
LPRLEKAPGCSARHPYITGRRAQTNRFEANDHSALC